MPKKKKKEKEPFVKGEDRPEIELDAPVGDMTVRASWR